MIYRNIPQEEVAKRKTRLLMRWSKANQLARLWVRYCKEYNVYSNS